MNDLRKIGVSVRMNAADLRGVKRLAQRVGARDSDVIRFAVKLTLARLASIVDADLRGADLLLAIVDAGPEFLRFFDIDMLRLEQLVNEGLDRSQQVERTDIALILRSIGHVGYGPPRLGAREAAGRPGGPRDGDGDADSLRRYLLGKYGMTLENGLRGPGGAA